MRLYGGSLSDIYICNIFMQHNVRKKFMIMKWQLWMYRADTFQDAGEYDNLWIRAIVWILGEVLGLMTLQCWLYSADAQQVFIAMAGSWKKSFSQSTQAVYFYFLYFFLYTKSTQQGGWKLKWVSKLGWVGWGEMRRNFMPEEWFETTSAERRDRQ
jgi:hypothetical protein